MMYYGTGMGSGWILMSLAGLAFTVLVVLAVVAAVRGSARPQSSPAAAAAATEQVLADRFARGDIDAEEYEHRLRTLRAANR